MLKCNQCNNRDCGEHASIKDGQVQLRRRPYITDCIGQVAAGRKGFSLLELAVDKSGHAVNDLLRTARIKFLPANNNRGFNLKLS